jgi:hypothetical protein
VSTLIIYYIILFIHIHEHDIAAAGSCIGSFKVKMFLQESSRDMFDIVVRWSTTITRSQKISLDLDCNIFESTMLLSLYAAFRIELSEAHGADALLVSIRHAPNPNVRVR